MAIISITGSELCDISLSISVLYIYKVWKKKENNTICVDGNDTSFTKEFDAINQDIVKIVKVRNCEGKAR